jgi:hypothetical protein
MTPEEIDLSLANLMRANAPEILVRAAKVLFEAGWHDAEVGRLILAIMSGTQVFSTMEEAEAALDSAPADPNKALN